MTMKTISLLAAAIAGTLTLASGTATAGRGGSAARIKDAIRSGSVDAIVAEVERAERLTCPGCVEPLMEALDDSRYEVREVAAWWFARRPSVAASFIDRSMTDLTGTDGKLARNAADFLGVFANAKHVAPLSAALARTDLSSEARAHAALALGRIGTKGADPALAAAMTTGDATVKVAAIQAWLAIRNQTGAAPIAALVRDADANVRAQAAGAVGRLREASARAALEVVLASDADAVVRRNAAWALGRIGDPGSRAALTAAANDPSPLVGATAKAALAALR